MHLEQDFGEHKDQEHLYLVLWLPQPSTYAGQGAITGNKIQIWEFYLLRSFFVFLA